MAQKIILISAMTPGNQVIGNNNKLPSWTLPKDLKRFKDLTNGKPIIMGRRTHESIGKVLPGRTNIVITSRRGFYANGAAVVYSVNSALELARTTDPEKDIMIIGGEQIYRQTIVFADEIYATFVHGFFEGDSYFPQIKGNDWKVEGYDYFPADNLNHSPHSFIRFVRRKN